MPSNTRHSPLPCRPLRQQHFPGGHQTSVLLHRRTLTPILQQGPSLGPDRLAKPHRTCFFKPTVYNNFVCPLPTSIPSNKVILHCSCGTDVECTDTVLPVTYTKFAGMMEPGDTLYVGRYLVSGADSASLYLEVSYRDCSCHSMLSPFDSRSDTHC